MVEPTGRGDDGRHHTHQQAHPRAPDEAREHVAAELVGAQQGMRREGRRHAVGEIGVIGVGEREHGRQ